MARKCDRCGALYESYQNCKSVKRANAIILIDRDYKNQFWERETYDLCPDCQRELCNWLNAAKMDGEV